MKKRGNPNGNPQPKSKLIPLTSETAKIIGAMPERPSLKKKLANKINGMKRAGVTPERIQAFVDFIEDAEVSAGDIYLYLERAKDVIQDDDPTNMIHLARAKMELHKRLHGDKINITQKNVNLNINANMKLSGEIDDFIKRTIEDEDAEE